MGTVTGSRKHSMRGRIRPGRSLSFSLFTGSAECFGRASAFQIGSVLRTRQGREIKTAMFLKLGVQTADRCP